MDNTRARKPGGGRKPSKPEYSASKNLAQQMKAAADLYTDEMSLQAIADENKARLLLMITENYQRSIADEIRVAADKIQLELLPKMKEYQEQAKR